LRGAFPAEATIAATDDPMFAFARRIDPDLRMLRHTYEDEVQAERPIAPPWASITRSGRGLPA
jgi:hypothetical protein